MTEAYPNCGFCPVCKRATPIAAPAYFPFPAASTDVRIQCPSIASNLTVTTTRYWPNTMGTSTPGFA